MLRSFSFVVALGASLPFSVVRAQTADVLYELPSPHVDDRFSHSVCGLGDIDGDGVPDFAAGGPDGPNGGMVRVYSGADGALLQELRGPGADRFGTRVRRVGDTDLDGRPDFLVSAPAVGEVYLYSGATLAVLRTFAGAAPRFGEQIDGVGDVDRDGVPDIAIADWLHAGTGIASGQVTVYSGLSGQVLHRFTGNSGDRLGAGLSAAGDWDGDGYADVAVLASQATFGGRGYVAVFSGRNGSRLRTITPPATSLKLGDHILAGRDVTGDGAPDLVLVVVENNTNQRVEVYSGGSSPRPVTSVSCRPACRQALHRFAFVGDVDGDGTEDLAVATFEFSAWVYVFSVRSGRFLTSPTVRCQAGGCPGLFRWELDGAGDLNGDGVPELLIGGHGYTPNVNHGTMRVASVYPRALRGDRLEILSTSGGTMQLELDAGSAHAGQPYFVLGSVSGIHPGVSAGAIHVPLNPDLYTALTLASPSYSAFAAYRGTLDALGTARAALRVPAFAAGLTPFTLHHAFVATDAGGNIVTSSSAVPLRIR